MRITTSSKTNTFVIGLILLGLLIATGFAYWGIQNWSTFSSDYYKKGYLQETGQKPPLHEAF